MCMKSIQCSSITTQAGIHLSMAQGPFLAHGETLSIVRGEARFFTRGLIEHALFDIKMPQAAQRCQRESKPIIKAVKSRRLIQFV